MLIMGVELFHCDHIGMKLFDHFYYTIVHGSNSLGHVGGSELSRSNDASLANARSDCCGFQDSVAGDLQARVYAKDAGYGWHSGVPHPFTGSQLRACVALYHIQPTRSRTT